jgi:hypothetical protein
MFVFKILGRFFLFLWNTVLSLTILKIKSEAVNRLVFCEQSTFYDFCAEFVLKHAEFAHLREVPEFPNSLRPVDSEDGIKDTGGDIVSEGLNLVCEMVRQVLEVHVSSCSRIHIGCDEVWCLGQSPITAAVLETRGLNPVDIFLRHVVAVARFVKKLQPRPQVVSVTQIFVGPCRRAGEFCWITCGGVPAGPLG